MHTTCWVVCAGGAVEPTDVRGVCGACRGAAVRAAHVQLQAVAAGTAEAPLKGEVLLRAGMIALKFAM